MNKCECGCGVSVKKRFVLGHNSRTDNPWKGAKWTHSFGRTDVKEDNNPAWKGDDASYIAKHQWIKRNFGKANKCEFDETHKANVYQWANIGHRYKRKREDWKMLCPPCHFKFDGVTGKKQTDEIKRKISEGLKRAYAEGRRISKK